MYLPDKFSESRVDVLHRCIRENPFGTLVYAGRDGVVGDHFPFLIDPEPTPFGTLRGHVARANTLWKEFPADQEALIIFHGPSTYVTPTWYAAKQEHGKAVPTWNYVVVHAYGRPRFIEDAGWLREHVTQNTNRHEAGRPEPWKVTDAPGDYIAKQLRAIVGIEIPLTRLFGKWKANQNRSAADVRGVTQALKEEGNAFARAMRGLDSQFKDHFSSLAAQYASFRPRYPAALFDYLAEIAPSRSAVWDCACGSGQATLDLAERFDTVVATDASAQQVSQAPSHPRVTFRTARAEESGLPDESMDLVTVAQSLHWFDLDAFYAEARRVLRTNGVLAVWTYGVHTVADPEINARLQEFYGVTVGEYWPPERKLVEEGYRSLRFPFQELKTPAFEMSERWTLPQLLGYLRSWSATSRYVQKNGTDPVTPFGEQIAPLWGDGERVVHWPLGMRIGRKL